MSPRPRSANQCRDQHEEELAGGERKVFLCSRGEGHSGSHAAGSITWARRFAPPPSGRVPAPPPRPSPPPR